MAKDSTLSINRIKLIEKIKENKDEHIKDYHEAVTAYGVEADRQLKEQTKLLKKGNLDIKIKLVSPVDKSSEYDKLITMFEWDTRLEVQLTQSEFNEYVLDESQFAIHSKFLNSTYKG